MLFLLPPSPNLCFFFLITFSSLYANFQSSTSLLEYHVRRVFLKFNQNHGYMLLLGAIQDAGGLIPPKQVRFIEPWSQKEGWKELNALCWVSLKIIWSNSPSFEVRELGSDREQVLQCPVLSTSNTVSV